MQNISFITSLLTFYLKGEIGVDNLMLNLKKPNTFLEFIPLGRKSDQVPVPQISTAATEFKLNTKELVIGFVVFLISCAFLNSAKGSEIVEGLIYLAIGVLIILNAFKTTLTVTATSGMVYTIYFIIFEKNKAEAAKKLILDAIVNRANDTNVRMAAEMQMQQSADQTQAIVNAVNNLNQNNS